MKYKFVFFCLLLMPFTVPVLAVPAKIRVACIGNSVTYGYGLADPSTESYPARLQRLLGAGYEVQNFGHSGATLLKKGHRPYYRTAEFIKALDFVPDIAVIHLGLNDTDPRDWNNYGSQFRGDYSWLIDTLRKTNPAMKIYVCLMTPIFNRHPRFLSGTRDWYWKVQDEIARVASVNQTGMINLHKPFYDRPNLFPDALHPDSEGAMILAEIIYGAITGDHGGLRLAPLFGDNMVVQRNRPVPVYGTANANRVITVNFANRTEKTTSLPDGTWTLLFPSVPAGGPYVLTASCGNQQVRCRNVLSGDVWFCSGQSNMLFRLNQSFEGNEAIGRAGNGKIRLLQMKSIRETGDFAWDSGTLKAANELNYFDGQWQDCTSQTAATFSAIAFYFGKNIQEEVQVPVGLVEVAVGGAPIVSFMDRHTMEFDDYLVNELYDWRHSDFIMPWVRQRAARNLDSSKAPLQRHPYEPCYNYEAAVSGFIHSPVKGVLWYQGESDTHNVDLYAYNFRALVGSWRKSWGQDLPFYFVQLSSIDRPSWPYFRDMQRRLAMQIPGCYMAVSSDLGDSLNVHPVHKEEIGKRLALLALENTYHRKLQASGPVVIEAVQNSNEVTVRFSSAKKLQTADGRKVRGFEVMDEKGGITSVTATLSRHSVILVLPEKEKIIKVLYAFKPFTRANLVNETGLPASTFSIAVQ